MKKAAILILVLALVFSLAACGADKGSTDAPAAENAGAEPAAEAKTDAAAPTNLTVGIVGEPNTLDPEQGGGIIGVYESLFGNDADKNLVMKLATGYEWEDDNTLVIHLREGVKFHDGNDFTASDVLFSLKVCEQNPQMSNRVANIDVENSEIRDDYTVALKTYEYSAVQINYLCTVIMLDQEWCNDFTDEMDQKCNGTGPYVFMEWKMGDRIILERNEEYWGDKAGFETVNIVYFNDPSTAFMEFETGNLDVVEVQNAEDVAVMESGAVDGYMETVLTHHVTVISMGQLTGDTFANENLRQAIAHAIDVNTMITTICGDMAIPATSLIPSDDKNHIDVPFEYDPDLAREYLETYKQETGAESVSLHMILDNEGYNPDIAEAMQAYLAEVGIDMTIETCMKFDLIPRMIAGEVEFTLNSIGGGADTNDMFAALERGSGNTVAEFTDDTLCELIVKGQTAKDEAERTEIYKQIQQLNYDGAWTIPLYEPQTHYAARNEFQGVCADAVSGENLNIPAIYYAG